MVRQYCGERDRDMLGVIRERSCDGDESIVANRFGAG